MHAWGPIFLSAAGFGLAYNAAPGAVNTEALRRGLARGARAALLVQLGALIGDSAWAALALTGTAFLIHNRSIEIVLGLAGGCFLLRLAWNALHEAVVGRGAADQETRARGDFATGLVFSVANPLALAFWTGVGGGLTASSAGHQGGSVPVLLAGFVTGALAWCLGIPLLIGWGRRLVRPAVFRWVNAICGLALGYFSVRLLWSTVEQVLAHPMERAESLARTMAGRRVAPAG